MKKLLGYFILSFLFIILPMLSLFCLAQSMGLIKEFFIGLGVTILLIGLTVLAVNLIEE